MKQLGVVKIKNTSLKNNRLLKKINIRKTLNLKPIT